jgi:ADP-L-glycero-D-manno-heptose 6-epimerase
MIIITGGAGFIGSTLAKELCSEELIILDRFSDNIQKLYLDEFPNARLVNLSDSKDILEQFRHKITFFYHFGANSSTNQNILNQSINLNIYWSQYFWDYCTKNNIPFVFASSAATYGDGSKGFSDEMNFDQLKQIKLNNFYGWSKMYFDLFVLNQEKIKKTPPIWFGLKFFNVYGVNEFHKKNQCSVLHSFLKQLYTNGKIELFKSLNKKYLDGEQKRDFVSVNFCVEFIKTLKKKKIKSGLLNVGTGKPKTFISFANDIMNVNKKKGYIDFIDMPKNLQNHYQYFTKSENNKTEKIHQSLKDFNYMEDLLNISKKILNNLDE